MPGERSHHALTVVTVALAIFMTNLDTSIVNIALPTLARTFNADTDTVSRVVLVYLLAIVSFLLVFGKISDRIGSEKIFTLGYLVFTLASILCAFSPSLELLILFRFIQGIGSAMLLATWGAIIAKYLPVDIRGRAFGFVTVFGGVGMAIGAPVGGFLITLLSWKWIFLINLPVGIMALILIRFTLKKNSPSTQRKEKLDLPGSLLSFFGMLCFFLLLNSGQDWGWLNWKSISLLGITIISFFFFYRQETKCSSPILDFKILRNSKLLFGYLTTLAVMIVMAGFSFLFPFFFDYVSHFSTSESGLLLMIFPLVSIVISPLAGYFSDKKSARMVSMVALLAVLVSSALFAFFGMNTSYFLIIGSFIIFGVGLALFFTSNAALVMSHVAPGKEGMLSALLGAVSYLGSAIGINLFEVIFTLQFPNDDGMMVLDKLSSQDLISGFLHASVFGVLIAILGFGAAFVSKEKQILK